MQAIHEQLQQTVADLHRKAIDADKKLDQLQQSQQGKFSAIFDKDSEFESDAKRFGPYVQEIAQDWQALKTAPSQEFETQLTSLVKKIETILTTIAQFNGALKG